MRNLKYYRSREKMPNARMRSSWGSKAKVSKMQLMG